jgi:hypothetical protein
LTFLDGRQNTQAILWLKWINGDVWGEFYTEKSLDRKAIRRWTCQLEELKDWLRSEGHNVIYAGCSDEARVKWVTKLFGFEKIREVTVDEKVWTVVAMCF